MGDQCNEEVKVCNSFQDYLGITQKQSMTKSSLSATTAEVLLSQTNLLQ